jgi:hypothetical protein
MCPPWLLGRGTSESYPPGGPLSFSLLVSKVSSLPEWVCFSLLSFPISTFFSHIGIVVGSSLFACYFMMGTTISTSISSSS